MPIGEFSQPAYVVTGIPDPATPGGFIPAGQNDAQGAATTINAANANFTTGVPTPGSFAAAGGSGKATASVQVTANTLNQPLYAQGSLDGTNWVTLGPLNLLNQATGVWSANIPAGATGVWTVAISDMLYFRLSTGVAALTGSASVRVNTSATIAIVSPEVDRYSALRLTAAGAAKVGAGVAHTISIAGTIAAPTAGLLSIYDSLSATGTVLYSEWVPAGVLAHTITLDAAFALGLFIGFDGTLANVAVTTSYL